MALSVFGTSTARADESQPSEAEALFRHGVELMKADNCTEAVPEFIKSDALDPSAATLLNLGNCYARLGRNGTAWKTFKRAEAAALAEKDDALRERAAQATNVLYPTLTKVQLVTPKNSSPLLLRLNGEVLDNYDGLPVPLDPGENVIEAAAPGREPWHKKVTANDLGATLVIEVPNLRPTAPLPPAVRPVSPGPRSELQSPPDYRIPAAIVGGAGVVAIVVGAVFGVNAQSSYDGSLAHCSGNYCTQAGIDARDHARDQAAVSTVMFAVGAVAVATGVVLWVVSPSRSSAGHATYRVPSLQGEVDRREMMVESQRW